MKSIAEQIDFENGWAMSEADKLFVLSFIKSCVAAADEIEETELQKEYSEYYERIKKNGIQAEKDLIQKVAFEYSEAVMHEIYYYYSDDEIVTFIEKALLGRA